MATTVDTTPLRARINRTLADQRARLNFATQANIETSDALKAQILPASTGGAGKAVSGSKIGDRSHRLRTALTIGGSGNIAGHAIVADSVDAFFGADIPYLRIHDEGGVIRAKNSKYLTIPMSDAAERLAAGGSVRGKLPGSFVVRSKAGNLFIVTKEGEGLRFWFRLKESVKIPKRPIIAPALKTLRKSVPKLGSRVRLDIKAAWDAS